MITLLSKRLALNKSLSFGVSNHKITLTDPSNNSLSDQFIYRYNDIFAAYLYKRRLTREQIPPKIHIIENQSQEANHMKYQSLFPMKKTLSEKLMHRILTSNPGNNIDSAYIISVFSDDCLKDLLDQYLCKVMVCGRVVESKEQVDIQRKVNDLFRCFYWGETQSAVERQILRFYLAEKQKKYYKYQRHPTNAFFRCLWTEQDQRVLQQMANWRNVHINLSDQNFRHFFQPLNILSRLETVKRVYSLMNNHRWYDNMQFNLFIKGQFVQGYRYYLWVMGVISARIMHWCQCIQFTHNLEIPPDYFIELSVLQIHFWLVTNRLNKIGTSRSIKMARSLRSFLQSYLRDCVISLNLKRQNMLNKDLYKILKLNWNFLDNHFKKDNYIVGIDKLVWSIVFNEQDHHSVYHFSQYLIKNYQRMDYHSQQDIFNGLVQFDVFDVGIFYQQKILKINQQFSNKHKNLQQQSELKFPLHAPNLLQSKLSVLIQKWLDSLFRTLQKHSKLNYFDHYNTIEAGKAQIEQEQQKGVWKTKKDQLRKLQNQLIEGKKIKKIRKNMK